MSEENLEELVSEEKFDVFYKCMRCGHETALEELSNVFVALEYLQRKDLVLLET
jgi:DNA-directed RNA polymerase subunit RPC12/RpoP